VNPVLKPVGWLGGAKRRLLTSPFGRINSERLTPVDAGWLNRIGLTMQFLALFLLTPDIFGTERMEEAAERLSRAQRLFWTKSERRFDDSAQFIAYAKAVIRLLAYSALIVVLTLLALLATRSVRALEVGGMALAVLLLVTLVPWVWSGFINWVA
jgi:hypothetical protein